MSTSGAWISAAAYTLPQRPHARPRRSSRRASSLPRPRRRALHRLIARAAAQHSLRDTRRACDRAHLQRRVVVVATRAACHPAWVAGRTMCTPEAPRGSRATLINAFVTRGALLLSSPGKITSTPGRSNISMRRYRRGWGTTPAAVRQVLVLRFEGKQTTMTRPSRPSRAPSKSPTLIGMFFKWAIRALATVKNSHKTMNGDKAMT